MKAMNDTHRYFILYDEDGERGAMELATDQTDKVLAVVRQVYPRIEEVDAATFRRLQPEIEAETMR